MRDGSSKSIEIHKRAITRYVSSAARHYVCTSAEPRSRFVTNPMLALDLVDFQRRVSEFLPRSESEWTCQQHTAERIVCHLREAEIGRSRG